jgi:hypothetical protein
VLFPPLYRGAHRVFVALEDVRDGGNCPALGVESQHMSTISCSLRDSLSNSQFAQGAIFFFSQADPKGAGIGFDQFAKGVCFYLIFNSSFLFIVIRGYDQKGFFVNDPFGEWFESGYRNDFSGENLHYSNRLIQSKCSPEGIELPLATPDFKSLISPQSVIK